MVGKTVVVAGGEPRVRPKMSGSEEKIGGFDYHVGRIDWYNFLLYCIVPLGQYI
jgi:hypothetical protein